MQEVQEIQVQNRSVQGIQRVQHEVSQERYFTNNFPIVDPGSPQGIYFLRVYQDETITLIYATSPSSKLVLSHMDGDLSNVVLYPNLDAVAGVIDWAAFCPQGRRNIHRMCLGRRCLMGFTFLDLDQVALWKRARACSLLNGRSVPK